MIYVIINAWLPQPLLFYFSQKFFLSFRIERKWDNVKLSGATTFIYINKIWKYNLACPHSRYSVDVWNLSLFGKN